MLVNKAILPDDKLGEIPLDTVSHEPVRSILHPSPQRMSGRSININLFRHDKLWIVSTSKGADGFGGAGFLIAELVAREEEDTESLVVVFVEEFGELRIVASGEATLCGHVNDNNNLSTVTIYL